MTSRSPSKVYHLTLLAFLVLWAYSNTLQAPFIFDDHVNIVQNATLRSLSDWQALLHPPYAIINRPLLNISLALNHAISGNEPWSYHVVNLVIHVLATLTLFGMIRRTLTLFPSLASHLPATLTAWWAAAWWGLHPIQTQSVTYTIQRCESLSGLMVLLTLYTAIRGWESARYRTTWFGLSVLATLVGIGVKEVSVISLPLTLLYDRFYRGHGFLQAWRKSPALYWGLVLAMGVMVANMYRTEVATHLASRHDATATPWGYFMIESGVILHYVRLILWPDQLTLDYVWPTPSPLVLALTTGTVLLALGISVRLYHRRHAAGFPLIWWWTSLAPSSSFFPIHDVIFEHRVYLALAGLVLPIIGLLASLAAWKNVAVTRAVPLAGLGMGLLLAWATWNRNQDYRSVETIWLDTLTRQPNNHRAISNLANHLHVQGRHAEVVAVLQHAIHLFPADGILHLHLGSTLADLERYAEAAAVLQQAVALQPDAFLPRFHLARVHLHLQAEETAVEGLARAAALAPLEFPDTAAKIHRYLGDYFMRQGQPGQAQVHDRAVTGLHPDHATTRQNAVANPPVDGPGEERVFLGMTFVWVPAGHFVMGCGAGNPDCYENEMPAHAVTLDGFWLGKTEVTQGQWQEIMGHNPASFADCGADCPVESISWQDAQTFISRLNERGEGRFRLPTEAEWEYACRSGGKEERHAGSNHAEQVAWHGFEASGKTVQPVGTKQPNGLGLHDMSGNVWEWVGDWHTLYGSGSRKNPVNHAGSAFRVLRGGSWGFSARGVRCVIRYASLPDHRDFSLGVRLLREADDTPGGVGGREGSRPRE